MSQTKNLISTNVEHIEASNITLKILLVFVQNKVVLTLLPIATGVITLCLTYLIPPTYTARAVIMPPQSPQTAVTMALQNLGGPAGAALGNTGVRNLADQHVSLLRSINIQDRLIERFSLIDVYKADYRFEARRTLEGNSRIVANRRDGLISIEVDDTDRKRAAEIANAYIAELRRLTSQLALSEAQQRRKFFESQLLQVKERLTSAQHELQSAGFNEGAIRAEPRAATEMYSRLKAEFTAAQIRLQSLRRFFSEESHEIRLSQIQVSELSSQLRKIESTNALSGNGDYITRFREFKYQEALHEILLRQVEAARLDENRDGAMIQVIDRATEPEYKSSPKRALLAIIASLVSLFFLMTALITNVLLGTNIRTFYRAIRHD